MDTTQISRQKGFTMIELIIALGLIAFIVTIGIPSFTTLIQNNRMATQVNSFVGAIRFSRGQAITRRSPVTVCKSDDGNACGNSQVEWEQGWIVFLDHNADGSVNAGGSKPDKVLKVWEALHEGATLRGNSNIANRITFDANGFSSAGRLVLCDDRGFNNPAVSVGTLIKRVLVLSSTGRLRLDTDINNLAYSNLCP